MSIKGKEAIGYVRVSTVRQVEEGNSIQSQIDDLRNYANSRGLILRSKNIVIDDGTSGDIPLWDRANAQRLLIKAHYFWSHQNINTFRIIPPGPLEGAHTK